MIPYLADGGIVWGNEDIDGDKSGRTFDGIMHREFIDDKDKHTLKFREMELDEIRLVRPVFKSVYLIVETNIHPDFHGTVTFQMYNSSRRAATSYLDEDGHARFQMEDISLIER